MDAVFESLAAINVNEHTEKKQGLTYLTWSWAWDEIKRRYPDASYTIWKNPNGLPYVYDELTGFMVYTSVTINGITHEMWLPVMDAANKAMKAQPYKYQTRSGEKTVEAATMFDINKTIMRCLVKNLAMFGLGLYIYAGEDLPNGEEEKKEPPKPDPVKEADLRAKVLGYINRHNVSKEDVEKICAAYKVENINQMSLQQCSHYIQVITKRGGNIDE